MDKSPNPPALLGRLWLVLLGAIITLAGLFFAVGGGKLVSLGGSLYFLLAGIGLVVSGLLIIRRKPLGALLFGLERVVVVEDVCLAGFLVLALEVVEFLFGRGLRGIVVFLAAQVKGRQHAVDCFFDCGHGGVEVG